VSFFRKLFGGADEPEEPTGTSVPSPAPSPPVPASEPAKPSPARIRLVDLPPRQLHSYFEYVGGGSSKFYAVSLEEEEGGTWRVRFNFGRIDWSVEARLGHAADSGEGAV
jgi:hypothetical protein